MSILGKIGSQARTFIQSNARFMSSPTHRRLVAELMYPDSSTELAHRIRLRENESATDESRVYEGLAQSSLALADLKVRAGAPRFLNVVVPEVRPGAVFAGVSTALEVGIGLASRLGAQLRVIMLVPIPGATVAADAAEIIRNRFPESRATVVTRDSIAGQEFGDDDYWLATHWTTAHALQVAARLERVDASRVAYLIQDYEAGFNPWSSEYALARSTYHAGFAPIVNSTPLARHLRTVDGLVIDDSNVFGPAFDLDLLHRTSEKRSKSDAVKVLFYARPSKPRNLYKLGLASLRSAVRTLGPERAGVEFYSAGERHKDLPLGFDTRLSSLGTMAWDDYFEFLTTANVVLSLQMSPHPSHPPFDAAISGAYAVTNDFDGGRSELHPRLAAVDADADALGAAIVSAIRAARTEGPGGFAPLDDAKLGGPIERALDSVAARLLAG